MKKKLFIFILLTFSFVAKSQTINIISDTDFESIKINTISLKQLKNTNGKQAKIEKLLGVTTSFSKDENETYNYFKFNGLSIDFFMSGKAYIESFEINSNQSSLTIKNNTITLGENIDKLGKLIFSVGRNGAKSILYSTCEDCDVFINIEFNQTTNLVTKISYMDMS